MTEALNIARLVGAYLTNNLYSSMVEHRPIKPKVAGSTPVTLPGYDTWTSFFNAQRSALTAKQSTMTQSNKNDQTNKHNSSIKIREYGYTVWQLAVLLSARLSLSSFFIYSGAV